VPVVCTGGHPYFAAEACHACGACAAQCPAEAIEMAGLREGEVRERVSHELSHPRPDTTIVFQCGYTEDVVTLAGPHARYVSVPCLLRVSEAAVLDAFEKGAERIVFAGCTDENCRFPHARPVVAARGARIRDVLDRVALGERFTIAGGELGYRPAPSIDDQRRRP
jgi:ferredoxin